MIASANGCNMIGINATYEKHQEICLHLLSTRGLTCCYFCVGKSSSLRKTPSEHLGVTAIQMGDVVIEVRRFILDCYTIGLRNHEFETMTETRERYVLLRFLNVSDGRGVDTFSWNPCTAFTEGPCVNVSVCQMRHGDAGVEFFTIGYQQTAQFSYVTKGEQIVAYNAVTNGTDFRTAMIFLTCVQNDSTSLEVYGQKSPDLPLYLFELKSPYACPKIPPLPTHTPVTGAALGACTRMTSCSCRYENGQYIDLSPLAESGTPRFLNVSDGKGQDTFSWNPCTSFTEGECENVSVCQIHHEPSGDEFFPLGLQSTADFQYKVTGEFVLYYTAERNLTQRAAFITLTCVHGDTTTLDVLGQGSPSIPFYSFELKSPYACPQGVPMTTPTSQTPPTSSTAANLHTLEILTVAVLSCVVVLIVLLIVVLLKVTGIFCKRTTYEQLK